MEKNTNKTYGNGDTSYQAAGGETGVFRLVDAFFQRMATDDRFKVIYGMHPDDIEMSKDKLARFLCGWLGGPKRYQEKYGDIRIPKVHEHLPISTDERDQWLTCMQESIAEQDYQEDFKTYLIEQLSFPAEMVRKRCQSEV